MEIRKGREVLAVASGLATFDEGADGDLCVLDGMIMSASS